LRLVTCKDTIYSQNSQKTPKNSQDFDLKRVKTPKKGNFSTRNSQELYAEWNLLPFGFFVSYLCNVETKQRVAGTVL
jgi:hypothetical protein